MDLRQHLPSLAALTLLLPEPAQAHGRAQLQCFGALTAGDLDGLLHILFGVSIWSL